MIRERISWKMFNIRSQMLFHRGRHASSGKKIEENDQVIESTFGKSTSMASSAASPREISLSYLPFGFTLIDLEALRNSVQSISEGSFL